MRRKVRMITCLRLSASDFRIGKSQPYQWADLDADVSIYAFHGQDAIVPSGLEEFVQDLGAQLHHLKRAAGKEVCATVSQFVPEIRQGVEEAQHSAPGLRGRHFEIRANKPMVGYRPLKQAVEAPALLLCLRQLVGW